MCSFLCRYLHWNIFNGLKIECLIPRQSFMLGGHFTGAILKLPRRICNYSCKLPIPNELQKVFSSCFFQHTIYYKVCEATNVKLFSKNNPFPIKFYLFSKI